MSDQILSESTQYTACTNSGCGFFDAHAVREILTEDNQTITYGYCSNCAYECPHPMTIRIADCDCGRFVITH